MLGSVLLFLNMGGPEMILIFLVALLLFGGKKLPELARGLGKGLREFKDASDGIKREIHNNINSVQDAADVDKKTLETMDDPTTPPYVEGDQFPEDPTAAAKDNNTETEDLDQNKDDLNLKRSEETKVTH